MTASIANLTQVIFFQLPILELEFENYLRNSFVRSNCFLFRFHWFSFTYFLLVYLTAFIELSSSVSPLKISAEN